MSPRREGWQKAVDAAWRAYGTRHYRAVLLFEAGRRAAPFVAAGGGLAGLVYGVAWVWRHAVAHAHTPAPWLWVVLAVACLVSAVGAVGWCWARSPFGAQAGVRPASLLTAAGLVLIGIAWKGQ